MKKKNIERLFVYIGTLLVVIVLFIVAKVYAKMSQSKLEKTRKSSIAEVKQNEQQTKVKICRIFYQTLTDILTLPGTIEAYEDIDLAAKISGTVEWIGPKEGDRVKKGEKLLEIDVKAIKAQVEKAQTSYELAESKYKRMEDLFKDNVISKDEFDDAEASLKTAKASLEEAKVNLNYGTLYSPINGILDRKYVDQGEHIDGGKPVMKIVDIDKVKVILDVPEKDVLFFKSGQEVKLIASNNGSREFVGTIDYVATTADAAARTYPLKIVVSNKEHNLRPGMIVRANLVRRYIENGIAVPFFSIVEREDGKSVFIVKDGIAKESPIEYGMFQKGLVEIVNGLNVGDVLVVVGQRNLVDGEKVSITADLTDAAKTFMAEGKDLSQLVLE